MCLLNINDPVKLFYRYSLKGNTLLNLVLIYAALIELTQKSEDFEVKVTFFCINLHDMLFLKSSIKYAFYIKSIK